MKHFMSFTLSIIVIAVILIFHQYATAIIGDSGKPSQRAIIDDNDRQSLLQDVTKIKEEIKILQTKLNKAKEGENLTALYGGQSLKNLKELFNSLSTKISDGSEISDSSARGIVIVDTADWREIVIVDTLEVEQLRNLSHRGIIIVIL